MSRHTRAPRPTPESRPLDPDTSSASTSPHGAVEAPEADSRTAPGVAAAIVSAAPESSLPPAATDASTKATWLTTRADPDLGPAGRLVDLTSAESAAAPDGVLVEPTPDQLALRVR